MAIDQTEMQYIDDPAAALSEPCSRATIEQALRDLEADEPPAWRRAVMHGWPYSTSTCRSLAGTRPWLGRLGR